MTVKELKEKLSTLDENALIKVEINKDGFSKGTAFLQDVYKAYKGIIYLIGEN